MKRELRSQFFVAVKIMAFLTLLLGFIYPAVVTISAQLLFPRRANGGLIIKDSQVIGSTLIGQPFDNPKYFWGRPSATTPNPYNAASSSGSNLAPSNPALIEAVKERVAMYQKSDPIQTAAIPVDLVTASGSGLDPDISPAAAFFQARRVAKYRGLSDSAVKNLILRHITPRQFGFLGEPRVNVLELNIALDKLSNQSLKK